MKCVAVASPGEKEWDGHMGREMTHACKQNRNKIKQQASEHKCPKTTSNKTYTKTMRLRVILFNQSLEVVEHR